MATPHLSARQGEIAECVLLPGDPLRARYIAENYLENPVCYNEVRNMLGFTGYYNGKRISVQGTGMGIPSISIYTHELIHYFGAKRLIRTGSCGAIQKEIELRDIILSMSASTDSGLNRSIFNHGTFAPVAADELLFSAREIAGKMKINVRAGNVLTSDRYYYEDPDYWKLWADYGVMCIEMETAALYTIAAKNKVQALSILTVSDSIVNSEHCSAEERETSFNQMIELALEIL